MVDDSHTFAQGVRFFHVMRREDDGDTALAQGTNDVPECKPRLRVKTSTGFVEEQHLWIVGDGARDLNSLSETARKRLHESLLPLCKFEKVKQLAGPCGSLGMLPPVIAAVKIDVLPDCALAVERIELRDHAHEAAGLRRMRKHIDAGNGYAAGCGKRAGGAHTDGRGFAGSIRAQQAK